MALVAVAAATPASSTRVSGEQPQASASTGVVVGQVIDADTARPIAGAMVDIRGSARIAGAAPFSERAITDADGRFVFSQVPTGTYQVLTNRPGYVFAEYGQSQPRGRAGTLVVGTAPAVTDATVRMWAQGAISGVVLDPSGDPLVGATVRAAQAVMRGGRRILTRVLSEGMTDDRGAYRIANLLPGDYVVFAPSTVESAAVSTADWYASERAQSDMERARLLQFRESRAPTPSPGGLRVGDDIVSTTTMRLPTAPMLTADGRLQVAPTVYYPSATTVASATTIGLASGEHRPGIDIRLTSVPAFHVRGTVTGADGPTALIGVRLFKEDLTDFETHQELEVSATATGLDGRFTLIGVPAGRYLIKVLRVPQVTPLVQSDDAFGLPTLWATQAVVVGDADVDGVTLQLREGARVSGRIEFEGSETPDAARLGGFAVQLVDAAGTRDTAYQSPPAPLPDGAFHTLGYPPGRYFVSFAGAAGAQWHIKSARLGQRDLIDEPLELGSESVEGVIVTFTTRLSQITGTVAGLSGEQDALVVVIPADHRRWLANGMPDARTATAYTEDAGRFTVPNLRAGSYLAVALPAGEPEPDLQDPAVIARLAALGVTVQVPDRGATTIGLSLSRIGRQP